VNLWAGLIWLGPLYSSVFFCENSELDVGSIVVREFFAYLKTISSSKNVSARWS